MFSWNKIWYKARSEMVRKSLIVLILCVSKDTNLSRKIQASFQDFPYRCLSVLLCTNSCWIRGELHQCRWLYLAKLFFSRELWVHCAFIDGVECIRRKSHENQYYKVVFVFDRKVGAGKVRSATFWPQYCLGFESGVFIWQFNRLWILNIKIHRWWHKDWRTVVFFS